MKSPSPRSGGWVGWLIHPVALLAVAVLILGLLVVSLQPPRPVGVDAAADEFSAARALQVLEVLLAESTPHVTGSNANREIRGRIVDLLREWRYQPQIQSRFHCHPGFGSCAPVENIIAVRPGSAEGKAILLTAHYDSSWAGPGASDDGVGIAAVLEIARMAAIDTTLENEIIFLLSDGEEAGLIGAHAFAEHHELFQRVGLVINLEARGVTGRSTMFETGEGNRSLVRILSRSLERPGANSLAYEVYKRMPNDTDYSVYKARGIDGLNFGFTGGVALYHSRLDDVAHVDAGSLQQHGDNAWALIRNLEGREVGKLRSREDAAYIDIFGRVLWHYPVSIASGLTVLLTVLLVLAIVVLRKRDITFGGVVLALFAQVLVLVLLLLGAWLMSWPLGRWVDTNPIEHPSPWLARLALLLLCATSMWIVRRLLAHRISFGSATLACWLTFAILAFVLDFQLPAASFLALIPMAAFLVGVVLDAVRRGQSSQLVFASVSGFAAAAYIALYHFLLLDVVLPFDLAAAKVAPMILMLLPLLPAVFAQVSEPQVGWRGVAVLAGVVFAVSLGHLLVAGFSEERPRGMNLVYRQGGDPAAALVYLESPGNRVDGSFARAHDFTPREMPSRFASEAVSPYPARSTMTRPSVEHPNLQMDGAVLDGWRKTQGAGEGDSENYGLAFRVSAPEGAEQVVLALPHDTEIIRATVEGVLAVNPGEPGKSRVLPRLISITSPGTTSYDIEIVATKVITGPLVVTTRRALPASISDAYAGDWPADAQPIFSGFRAEIVAEFAPR